ncbi:SCO family protein [Pseudoruegeria sp. SHC-113]|uniref:SCO family protein n=1 Tax=Pseudoruegeria sp. SHC-113 TaxID=2855439 RepID=UPI0021BA7234|nr:SCO family protein [Pseudoruegeria sp. SHC-113]MCT8158603.1 SCO family protein [Pseudoruegeria sp. SHC-113]
MTRLIAIVASTIVIAMLGVLWFVTSGTRSDDQFAACRESQIAGGAGAIGGPFTLVNGDGETVTDADVITKPSILYFGYTFCPDVCPLDNVRNAEAVDLLAAQGIEVTPVFISIDPERDTPEVMKDYGEIIHDRMIALTGSEEQVKAASQAYKTYYRKQESEDEFYLVDHSTFSYLVLPDHGFVEFFKRDTTPQQMAESVACFVDAS